MLYALIVAQLYSKSYERRRVISQRITTPSSASRVTFPQIGECIFKTRISFALICDNRKPPMVVGDMEGAEAPPLRSRDLPAVSTMDVGFALQNSILPLLQSQAPVNLTKHDLNGLIKAVLQM